MALNANAIVSLADMKAWLDVPNTDVTKDAIIELHINSASDRIEKYLQRKLIRQQYVERYDGRNSSQLLLSQYPAEKPTQIIIDSSWVFDAADALELTAYDLQDDMTVKLNGSVFPNGTLNVKVTYYAGYKNPISGGTGPEFPSDIKLACRWLVDWQYQQRTDRRLGMGGKGKQGENISFLQGMPQEVKELLDAHVRMEMPLAPGAVYNL